MPKTSQLDLSLHGSIHDIAAADWDACAGPDNPFVSHAFLAAVEDSGSAGARTGWLPRHAALRDRSGAIVACAPMYAKGHSYGEYVFDHGWARAFEQAGGDYYPKLQVASPFSPVTGPRLLVRPSAPLGPADLASGLMQACREMKLSSVHVTFCTHAEYETLGEAGWLQRLGVQYHWHNAGYASFDDFLAALSSRKRKVLKRERRDANSCGLVFHTLRGSAIEPAHWKAFYAFYESTVDRKWGSAYLTEQFFSLLSAYLGDRVVLMLAEHEGTAGRRRAEPHGDRHAVRPQLGLHRGFSFSAFRALLLPRDRFRDRARLAYGGGRRAGGAQDTARVFAVGDVFRAFHCACGVAQRDRGASGAGAAGYGGGDGGVDGDVAVSAGGVRQGLLF